MPGPVGGRQGPIAIGGAEDDLHVSFAVVGRRKADVDVGRGDPRGAAVEQFV
jgi:hypothetical protein